LGGRPWMAVNAVRTGLSVWAPGCRLAINFRS
jgi:hypothetical protein